MQRFQIVCGLTAIAIAGMICFAAALAKAETLRGPASETQIAASMTGKATTSRPARRVLHKKKACVPRQTNATCYLVVLVCDDGYYTIPDVWHSCSTYACGMCFGGKF